MRSLRPSGFDELGLRRALSDRMLPFSWSRPWRSLRRSRWRVGSGRQRCRGTGSRGQVRR